MKHLSRGQSFSGLMQYSQTVAEGSRAGEDQR